MPNVVNMIVHRSTARIESESESRRKTKAESACLLICIEPISVKISRSANQRKDIEVSRVSDRGERERKICKFEFGSKS
jgi:RNase P/RNase MRP subunit p30